MEERNKATSILKTEDQGKLEVWKAESRKDQIRFYFDNDTKYIVAIENKEGCDIRLGEEKAEESNKKSENSINREELKEFIKWWLSNLEILLTSIIGVSIVGVSIIGLVYVIRKINNILVLIGIMNIICFIIKIVGLVIIETKETDPSLKSKHSAEHMMANFLEINKRLPKNIEEVKKTSRFSPECGSRDLIEGQAEDLICDIIAIIFAMSVRSIVVSNFSAMFLTNEIVLFGMYYLVRFVVGKVITKYEALNFIIEPMENVLTNIVQCANTTSKVKDRDIILAYCVAKKWLQVVYPEYYDEKEDVFWKFIPKNYKVNDLNC